MAIRTVSEGTLLAVPAVMFWEFRVRKEMFSSRAISTYCRGKRLCLLPEI